MKFSYALPAVLGFGALMALSTAWAADGRAVYEKTCALCHAQGVANAPRFGDQAAWAPRLAAGRPALVVSVIKGKGAMPPRAGVPGLKEADIKAAVDFMLSAVR